jgi:hypothetical protein
MEGDIKCWMRLWAVEESDSIKDAFIYQIRGREANWSGKINKLENMCIGNT